MILHFPVDTTIIQILNVKIVEPQGRRAKSRRKPRQLSEGDSTIWTGAE